MIYPEKYIKSDDKHFAISVKYTQMNITYKRI